MAKLLLDNTLVFLRYDKYLVPVSGSAFKHFVREKTTREFEKFNLPHIPLLFFEEPPDRMSRAYAWVSYNRDQKCAVAISCNASAMSGMTMGQLFDCILHEIAHHLTLFRHPDGEKEPNNGHGPLFFDACKKVGCSAEPGTTHLKEPLDSMPIKNQLLSPARQAYMLGDKKAAIEEAVHDIQLRTVIAYEDGDEIMLLHCIEDMKGYIGYSADIEALWAWFELKHAWNDHRRWHYILYLKNAADAQSALGQYFWAKVLLEGNYGMEQNTTAALQQLSGAMQDGFVPAIALWAKTMMSTEKGDPALDALVEMIEMDIGDINEVSSDITIFGKNDLFIPFLGGDMYENEGC